MNEVIEFDEEMLEDEEDKMGSVMHCGTQARIAGLLLYHDNLSVFTELSLDISQHDLNKYRLKAKNDLKPDVCAYLSSPPMPDEEFEDDKSSAGLIAPYAEILLKVQKTVMVLSTTGVLWQFAQLENGKLFTRDLSEQNI